jgi:hypothetical protein
LGWVIVVPVAPPWPAPVIVTVLRLTVRSPRVRLYLPAGTEMSTLAPVGSALASSTAARNEHKPFESAQRPLPGLASWLSVVVLTLNETTALAYGS